MTAARIFTTKTFSKWQRKTGLSDKSLIKAIQEIQSGLVDARLAKGLVKKRVAQSGRGKQSSARTLVATYFEARWFFIFGFSKNEKIKYYCEGIAMADDLCAAVTGPERARIVYRY